MGLFWLLFGNSSEDANAPILLSLQQLTEKVDALMTAFDDIQAAQKGETTVITQLIDAVNQHIAQLATALAANPPPAPGQMQAILAEFASNTAAITAATVAQAGTPTVGAPGSGGTSTLPGAGGGTTPGGTTSVGGTASVGGTDSVGGTGSVSAGTGGAPTVTGGVA